MDTFPSHLLDGYRNFMNGRYSAEADRYRQLAEKGQTPKTMVIACCDSRSAPETIFDCGPGELFVVRNVANLVPPYAPDGQNQRLERAFVLMLGTVGLVHAAGFRRGGGIVNVLHGLAPGRVWPIPPR